jgi:hypothetical protein
MRIVAHAMRIAAENDPTEDEHERRRILAHRFEPQMNQDREQNHEGQPERCNLMQAASDIATQDGVQAARFAA